MFKRTKVCAGVVAALGGGLIVSLPAMAQSAQRIEVTGSAIKRVDVEGPSPVEVITAKEIEHTGATTVNELIKSISSIDVFDQGELASNSPSGSGTANLAMRGLSSSNLLVLLNGRRLPVNALYDASGAGAAVDVNMIPISAIERIEILKDGGSAIYGADAVAGVVNIITKTDYQGGLGTVGYGQSSRGDAKEKRANFVAGFGDLTKDRFNVLLGLDIFKRDPVLRKDRAISKSVDFRPFGSSDGRSSFAPEGNVVDPNTGGFVGIPYTPCGPGNENPVGRCRYDFNASLLTSINGADRISGLAIGSFAITPDIKAFVEVVGSQTKDHFDAHPVPDYFIVPITSPAQQPYEIPGLPGQIYIAGRFMQGGPRMTDRKADLLSIATGLEGSTSGLDWKFSVGHGQSKVQNQDSGYYDLNKWVAATTSGQLNPTVTTNDPAFVESLKVTPLRVGKATTNYLNAQVSGDAFKLPAGPLRYAVGFSVVRESLSDKPDPLTQAGEVVGSIQQSAVDASRSEKGIFGELQIPVLSNLEAQLALRYDKYPNESKTSPKVGFKYSPTKQFAVRGSYTESFRAPVLKQLYGAQEQGAVTLTTDAECVALGIVSAPGECQINAFQVNGANPNLKAETGKTYNLGIVFEAGEHLNASVDWWQIKKQNDIASPTVESAVQQGLWSKDGARFFVYTNLQNIAGLQNQGIDVDARMRFRGTALGNLTFRDGLTYYIEQKTQSTASDPLVNYNATYALPRWRNTFSATSELGPWTFTGALRSVAGFYDSNDPTVISSTTRQVASDTEADVQVMYSGFKGLTLIGGIRNLADHMPPFSVTNATNNQYTQQGFAELYNNRGRFWYVSASYTFW
jgi:iron complex outermembrane recepter protein